MGDDGVVVAVGRDGDVAVGGTTLGFTARIDDHAIGVSAPAWPEEDLVRDDEPRPQEAQPSQHERDRDEAVCRAEQDQPRSMPGERHEALSPSRKVLTGSSSGRDDRAVDPAREALCFARGPEALAEREDEHVSRRARELGGRRLGRPRLCGDSPQAGFYHGRPSSTVSRVRGAETPTTSLRARRPRRQVCAGRLALGAAARARGPRTGYASSTVTTVCPGRANRCAAARPSSSGSRRASRTTHGLHPALPRIDLAAARPRPARPARGARAAFRSCSTRTVSDTRPGRGSGPTR